VGVCAGELTFVPGSINEPAGRDFDVTVAPFELSVPDYVF
jgi:hypothetical protein